MKNYIYLLLISIVMLNYSCENDTTINNNSTDTTKKVIVAFETAKQIFYSLPSPVETAMVLENSDVKFTDEFLLPDNAVDLYETSYDQAINLGVYSADLSYITLFGQQQLSIKYLATCKKLSDKLGILNVISDTILNELQNNVTNKDKSMNIISEQFMDINSYLEENDRTVSATLMVFGGWIEGLYLSVMLAGDNIDENPELIQMIYDQHISLEDLISLLQLYKGDKQIENYLTETLELKAIFDNLQSTITQEDFERIKSKVILLRDSFTKISY